MCGFSGFLWNQQNIKTSESILKEMGAALYSRGPDAEGIWVDSLRAVGFVHRRLAIVDLTEAGNQPMHSSCGRYTIAYNGEVYNFKDLRERLSKDFGAVFYGDSDTEVLLSAISCLGVEKTLKEIAGMFAFSLWDRKDKKLYLARDRMGEKPLYYGNVGGALVFGSQLDALAKFPGWDGEVDRDALALYMRYEYIPAPHSIYSGIFKLPAAHYVVFNQDGSLCLGPTCYWDIEQVIKASKGNPIVNADEAINGIDSLLKQSVRLQMTSDVPLGAFLSGGYDSTAVVSQMQSQSSRPIKTFSIGYSEKKLDEAVHAKAVATHLGTDHTELYLTADKARSYIPQIASVWDEPFADSAQLPTLILSEMARRDVTVCLSGDGGDELFCGYNRYLSGYQLWKKLKRMPRPLRKGASAFLKNGPVSFFDKANSQLPKSMRLAPMQTHAEKLADVLSCSSGGEYYKSLVSRWKSPSDIVLGGVEPVNLVADSSAWPSLGDFRDQMMFLDQMTYLRDNTFTKLDRASMAYSLESRAPFVDHRLIEFAWQIPLDLKCRDGKGKWILREMVHRYVPKELMERPKMGFGVPLRTWLRGPLKEWAEELLDESRLKREGFFDPSPLRKAWSEHLSGRRDRQHDLWPVLMFQAWKEIRTVK